MFDKINEGRYWDFGWQLVESCTKVSPGCENCWSLAKEKRLGISRNIEVFPERLLRPSLRKKPAVYSIWNDLFHGSVSYDFMSCVLHEIAFNQQHLFLVLTKRPERALAFFKWYGNEIKNAGLDSIPSQSENPFDYYEPLKNLWIGTTVENQDQVHRIKTLCQIPAEKHYLSCEPLLSELTLVTYPYDYLTGEQFSDNGTLKSKLHGIDWVIAGPETGPNKREMEKDWLSKLYWECKLKRIPFFDKKDVLGLNIKQIPE